MGVRQSETAVERQPRNVTHRMRKATQRLSPADASVTVLMPTADERIRVSDRVKAELDRRRREGESYNDVLKRLLEESIQADFDAGFGLLSDEAADWLDEQREAAKDERKDRMRRLETE